MLIYCIARNFCQEKISPPVIVDEIFNFPSCVCVNDYIEDMVTFTALAKIYSTEYFCITKLVKFLLSIKNFGYTVPGADPEFL